MKITHTRKITASTEPDFNVDYVVSLVNNAYDIQTYEDLVAIIDSLKPIDDTMYQYYRSFWGDKLDETDPDDMSYSERGKRIAEELYYSVLAELPNVDVEFADDGASLPTL